MTKLSSYPESPPNFEDGEWNVSDQICPDCRKLLWEGSWFDDSTENGGACIGTIYECGDCGYTNTK